MLKILDNDLLICSLTNKIGDNGFKRFYKIKNEIPTNSNFSFLQMKVALKILNSKNYDYCRLSLDKEKILEKINTL